MITNLSIKYSHSNVRRPILSEVLKTFDVSINILFAKIDSDLEGKLFTEIEGSSVEIGKVLQYLQEAGVEADLVQSMIQIDENTCVNCGLCTSTCPTGALAIEAPEWTLNFDGHRCVSCNRCLSVCPQRAISEQ